MANKLASAVMANIAAKNGYERKISDSSECGQVRAINNLDAGSENLLRSAMQETREKAQQQYHRPADGLTRGGILSLNELAKRKRRL